MNTFGTKQNITTMAEFRRILLDGYATTVAVNGDMLIASDGREVPIEEAVHLPPTEPRKII